MQVNVKRLKKYVDLALYLFVKNVKSKSTSFWFKSFVTVVYYLYSRGISVEDVMNGEVTLRMAFFANYDGEQLVAMDRLKKYVRRIIERHYSEVLEPQTVRCKLRFVVPDAARLKATLSSMYGGASQ